MIHEFHAPIIFLSIASRFQVDKMMAQCSNGKVESGTMDSLALEQERGITIMAKVTSTSWKGCKINLVDTPGPHPCSVSV
jgi:predicted membrane GTPase involved in stress response